MQGLKGLWGLMAAAVLFTGGGCSVRQTILHTACFLACPGAAASALVQGGQSGAAASAEASPEEENIVLGKGGGGLWASLFGSDEEASDEKGRTGASSGVGRAGEPGSADAGEEAASDTPLPGLPLVTLFGEDAKPAGAGKVLEKTYGQGSGVNYIACGGGTIKNNTSASAAEIAQAVSEGLPFAIEVGSAVPQVLIMHTHATETYRLSEGLWFDPADTARSTDRAVNMCAVGCVMADTLNAAGICTLHDEALNDYPSYTGSYANSRAVVQKYLAQYPSIKVVLDVHRDAIETNGSRMAPVAQVNGRQTAQVMLICGCNNGSTVKIPNYHENLRFAAAWETSMEALYPGFTRPVLFSYRFYNQDLTTGSLLIEIGGHGNNLNEALAAGQLAANALVKLFKG